MQKNEYDGLVGKAREARSNAYSPYSVYNVGAAVLCSDGRVFAGCNVENASYGLTICAERNAVAAMVCAGGRKVSAVAVVTKDGARPCGACLQVLAEFAMDESVEVYCANEGSKVEALLLRELLPQAFKLDK